MSDFEGAVFKFLSHNDTGDAPGHQGGLLIPKDMNDYFPKIEGATSPDNPTVDAPIHAELFVNGVLVGVVDTRYQYQTWGGTRSPERRITGQIGELRNAASKRDLLLIQRSTSDLDRYRFQLFTKGQDQYLDLVARTNGKSWGSLVGVPVPIGNAEVAKETAAIRALADGPVNIMYENRKFIESKTRRAARDRAFRQMLLELYEGRCAITGRDLNLPNGGSGLDGAHVVPVEKGGSDDPRNGLLLSKDVHWAFDRGLIGISPDLKVVVGHGVADMPSNDFVKDLGGQPLRRARSVSLSANEKALEWHRDHVLLRAH